MNLKKKKAQSVDASILHRRGNKIITGGRGREGPGRKRGEGGESEAESGMERYRREIQRVGKMNRNM